MNIILIMIPLSLVLLTAAALIFFWAVNHGQFDDLDSPSILPVSDNIESDSESSQEKQEEVNS